MLVDGSNVYTQSSAVLRVAARKAGLMPTDDKEIYMVDKLIADADDLRSPTYGALLMFGATPEATKKYHDETMPKHLANFERMLGDNEWFVGGKISVADITVFDVMQVMCTALFPKALDNFPKLKAHQAKMLALPNIAAYMETEAYKGLMALPALPGF